MWFRNDDEKARGIDYDLRACIDYNEQDGFDLDDIEKVLAVWEGANDRENWHWVLRLSRNRYVYLTGGCDYTGWDCQSWADHVILSETMRLPAAMKELAYNGEYEPDVLESLAEQLRTQKAQTWSESVENEMKGGM